MADGKHKTHVIAPALREAQAGILQMFPGGIGAVQPLEKRREVVTAMEAQLAGAVPPNDRVTHEERSIPGPEGAPDIRVRIYRPPNLGEDAPGVYYIHGGGMIVGGLETGHPECITFADQLGAVVVNVEYRLAPEHPYPAPPEDCYAGLKWMADHAPELGVDASRIAVYGESAGGGLTIATCLLARDRGGPAVRFMMPIYPMIDDRNETPSSHEVLDVGIWDRATNLEAWRCYLGGRPADSYAAPARCEDLSGLPPTFIDVGTVDLFRDEDIAFASRLLAAGVPCELHVYAGAFHGSELLAPLAPISQTQLSTRLAALAAALGVAA